MTSTVIVLIIAAVFIGAFIRATFGFGEAVVSMPLLALLPIDLHTSISLIGLAGLTVALFTAISGWRYVDRPALIRLVIGALIGIPIGILFIVKLPASIITVGLSIFLMAYGSYSFIKVLLGKNDAKPRLEAPFWSLPVGIISGIMGSAYNTHGVPVVVYGTLRRWEPRRFRGTLQAHFLISGVFVVIGQALGGLWTEDLFLLFGLSFPTIMIATLLGIFLHRRIPNEKFERYVFLLIVVLGILLVINPA
ncbi:sulfite exporter TauE/SafE family protein [Lederbergia sp. NSJ-179]|uniref:sulfite exporter TauE/SafE family protein n=1 Tax=Lederbergia sp. NSJ-179 TaxID=2931402 RepID=UPI001FD0F321|nr:sulfite exporter TauE/SafE family protein [Lederbergia sp. NSJ-179]MCJ7842534.1 sulfite exporter TauE/SafE family protein [Lederbergia sp. NSJ-179]